MEGTVRLAVAEVLLQPSADLESMIRRDSQISAVEQAMKIRAQKQAVRRRVWAFPSERANVSGFEDWQGMLAGHGAGPSVRLRDSDPEAALPEAGYDPLRGAIAGRRYR